MSCPAAHDVAAPPARASATQASAFMRKPLRDMTPQSTAVAHQGRRRAAASSTQTVLRTSDASPWLKAAPSRA